MLKCGGSPLSYQMKMMSKSVSILKSKYLIQISIDVPPTQDTGASQDNTEAAQDYSGAGQNYSQE